MTPFSRTIGALTGVKVDAAVDEKALQLTEWGVVGPSYRHAWRDATGAEAWERAFTENLLPASEWVGARVFDVRGHPFSHLTSGREMTLSCGGARRTNRRGSTKELRQWSHPATPLGVARWLERGWGWVAETEALLEELRRAHGVWAPPKTAPPRFSVTWRCEPEMVSFFAWNPWGTFAPITLREAWRREIGANAVPATRGEVEAFVAAWRESSLGERPNPYAALLRLDELGVTPDCIALAPDLLRVTCDRPRARLS